MFDTSPNVPLRVGPLGHADAGRTDPFVAAAGAPPELGPFIAGEENRLPSAVIEGLIDDALAARAESAADNSLPRSELVVLYGATGTGKTHLAESLVRRWQAQWPSDVVVALSAGEFAEQHAAGVEQDDLGPLRRRLRDADLLVLEDLLRLDGKPHAQWELLHTLDALESRGAVVVVTLDRPPQKLENFLPNLVGRLSAGTLCELAAPSLASRRVILEALAVARKLHIDPKAVELLAADRATTVRELRGSLAQLEAEALDARRREAAGSLFPLQDGERPHVDAGLVRRYLDERAAAGAPTLKQIAEQTARHFGLKVADLKSQSRRRNVVTARDTAIYLARRLTKKSLQELGEFFGDRDHTTVLHSVRKLEAAEAHDAAQRAALEALRAKLGRA